MKALQEENALQAVATLIMAPHGQPARKGASRYISQAHRLNHLLHHGEALRMEVGEIVEEADLLVRLGHPEVETNYQSFLSTLT